MNLRPLTFGEVLDLAFSLYRRQFTTFFTTALIPLLPLVVIWTLMGMLLPGSARGLVVMNMIQTLTAPYTLVATILVWTAITRQGAAAYAGEEPAGWRSALGDAFRRLPPVLGAAVLLSLSIFIGLLLLVIPGIVASIMFFAVIPIVVLEGSGVLAAFGRSRDLARGAWGRIFAVILVLIVITSLPSLMIGFVGTASLVSGLDGQSFNSLGFGVSQALGVIGTALTTPLLVLGFLLQYYDRRVRAEGLDLELATEQLDGHALK